MCPAPPRLRPPDRLSVDKQIEMFFASPVPYQRRHRGYRSTLHLLRREVQDCLVNDAFADEHRTVAMYAQHRRVFASALVIWAGIDLLAKFYSGDPSDANVGVKFKRYVNEMMAPRGGIDPGVDAGKVLYLGMRNPMMHAFNMNAVSVDVALESRVPPTYVVFADVRSGSYYVNLTGLYRVFVESIQVYRATLNEEPHRGNFARAFPTLGYIASTP